MVGDTEEARQCSERYPRPLNVIEGPLMKVSFQILDLISFNYGEQDWSLTSVKCIKSFPNPQASPRKD